DMELHASCEGHSLRLWTAQAGGPVAMEATASW
ncbi:protein dehydratase, partial [Rhodovulum sulfidophilum]|nr:protein dehydratase [Rhodovulum sulfidophilum]